MNCNICNKSFTSKANYFIHKREIHNHSNCKYVKCEFCEQDFYSPIFNKNKKIPYYLKCEKCRELQIKLNTNDLKSHSYVYNNDTRYFLNKGSTTQVCHIYNCNNETNNKQCNIHIDTYTKLCRGNKCNNYFISNEFNFCENCRDRNNKSKMKSRYNIYDLKIKLGGECKNCKCKELFKLEFAHINPKFKTKQITKIHPDKLENKLENIQLLCNLCNRIKSFNEQTIKRNKSCKDDKHLVVQQIKRQIDGCQICNWTHQNDNILSYCLDFEHIYGEKYKQISNLYLYKKENILDEIEKCRLICYSCHQMFTCFQRGGKMLDIYYNKTQIENFRNLLDNSIKNIEYNIIIKEIVKVYR
jgi:hypothetical protein